MEEGVCGGLTLVCCVLRCCVLRTALCTLHLLEERVHATMLTRTHTHTLHRLPSLHIRYMCDVDLLRHDLKAHFERTLSGASKQVGVTGSKSNLLASISKKKSGFGEIGAPPVAAKESIESIKVAMKSDGKTPNIHFGYANHAEIAALKKRGVLVRKLDKLEKHELKLKDQTEDLRKKEGDTKAKDKDKDKACGGCCGGDFSKYYSQYASQGKTNQEKIDKAKLALSKLDQRIDNLEADPLTSMPVCAYITFEEEEGRLRALHECVGNVYKYLVLWIYVFTCVVQLYQGTRVVVCL